jgi:hypothetical protein
MTRALNPSMNEADDRAVDPQGRSALPVTSRTEDETSEWWCDPSSLQLMSTRETYGDGSVTTNVVEAAGVVGSTDPGGPTSAPGPPIAWPPWGARAAAFGASWPWC